MEYSVTYGRVDEAQKYHSSNHCPHGINTTLLKTLCYNLVKTVAHTPEFGREPAGKDVIHNVSLYIVIKVICFVDEEVESSLAYQILHAYNCFHNDRNVMCTSQTKNI